MSALLFRFDCELVGFNWGLCAILVVVAAAELYHYGFSLALVGGGVTAEGIWKKL